MEYQIKKENGLFVLMSGSERVSTPGGHLLGSHHRGLMEELCLDAEQWGIDPTAITSMVSLQSSYLDFGLQISKKNQLDDFITWWPYDFFFSVLLIQS